MKKLLCVIFVLLLALACLLPASAQSTQQKLTLMIYMCGSNLESSYGSASADLQEMFAAAPGLQDVSVLIMNGGSTRWSTGYDPSQLQISELGKRGMRVVWRDAAASMGVSQTLTQLLQFGVEKYPAEDYALILWDHGGGPLEGVCWDELFSMDNLRLSELTDALEAAPLPGKLSWIGFDACLMSSLEVAGALAPYAEYMIASQETEPAYGWNYAFLSGLSEDQSGADTGRRIVDAYFEGRDDAQDVLTLACLDLSKAEAASQAVDSFFGQTDVMNHSLFNAVSGVRMNATGFGKGLRGFDDNGYDLVDLTDLSQRLSPLMTDAAPLQQALKELVNYSRANINDANGISIYHPYMNKNKFLASWKEDYAQLSLSPKYTAYIGQFGAWLTGDALTDWSGLRPTSLGFNANDKEELALQLSPEQTTDFASAQMLILKQFSLEEGIVSLIGTVPAQMNENGVVTATADWYSLYVMDGMGDIGGPLSYMMTTDAKQMVCQADLFNNSTDMLPLLYYLESPAGSEDAVIAQVRVADQATGTYTNRIAVNEADYDNLLLVDTHRRLPDSDGLTELPDFFNWELDYSGFSAYSFDPSKDWNFIWKNDILTDDTLYAVFSITDTQQNAYCSQPIQLQNPHRRPFTATLDSIDTQDFTAELSGYVNTAPNDAGLHLDFTVTNHTDKAIRFYFESLTLDGSRFINSVYFDRRGNSTIDANAASTISITIDREQLLGLTDISGFSLDFDYYPDASTYHSTPMTLAFRLENCSVSAAASQYPILAQAEQDGLAWQVLSIQPSEITGFDMLILAENRTDHSISLEGQVLINGVGSTTSLLSGTIPAGMSIVRSPRVHNDLFTENSFIGNYSSYYGSMISRHILQGYGIHSVDELTILNMDRYGEQIQSSITLPLSVSIPVTDDHEQDAVDLYTIHRLPDDQKLSLDKLVTLVDHSDVTIKLERILVGQTSIALALHLTNHSDTVQTIELDEVVISGAAYEHYGADETFAVAPHTSSVVCAVLGADFFDSPLTRTVDSLEFIISGTFSSADYPIHAVMKEAVPYAYPGGAYILPEDMLFTDQKPLATPTPAPTWEGETTVFMADITLPEDAAQYRRSFSVQLTPEQAAQAANTLMLIVQEAENGNLNLVNYQRADLQADNTLRADATGLVLCLDELPEVLVHTYQSTSETGAVQLYNSMTMTVTSMTEDFSSSLSVVSDLCAVLDYAGNQAAIDSITMTYDPLPERQRDITFVKFPTYELLCTLADPALPYVGAITRNDDDAWYNGIPAAWPNGFPIQLALRPITAQDHLYVMFSVKNADGTGYTLQAIPFLPENEQ